jgi:2-keto-3-deoxy-L-rhamnonate aldolase RhmA
LQVEAVKFPPIGRRGLAGERWNAWGMARAGNQNIDDGGNQRTLTLAECVRNANDNSIIGAMVETERGLQALDEILDVPNLDFVFLAPTDLSSDLGFHGEIRHPDVIKLVEEAGRKIHDWNKRQQSQSSDDSVRRHVAAGMLVLNEDDYIFWRKRNFQVLCGVAQLMFVDGAKRLLDDMNAYEQNGTEKGD